MELLGKKNEEDDKRKAEIESAIAKELNEQQNEADG